MGNDEFWAFIEAHFTPSERWYFVRLIHLHDAENAVYLAANPATAASR